MERLARLEYYYGKDFVNIVRLLKTVLYHDAVFRIIKDGIVVRGLGSGDTQYVEIFISSEYFNRYDLYSDSVDVSLDLDVLERVFRGIRRDEHVTISVYTTCGDDITVYMNTEKINYTFYNAKPRYTSDIEINAEHKVKSVVNTELLYRIMKFIDESSSTYYDRIFEISAIKDQPFITIRSKNAEFKMIVTDLIMSSEDTIVSRYDSRPLSKFTHHLQKLSRYVTLMYDRDQPLGLLTHDHIKIRYLQAPVI